jgi:mycothiol synthase
VTLNIRPAVVPQELEEILAVQHAAVPTRPLSLTELRRDVANLEEQYNRHFVVAELNDSIVGVADYHRSAGSYHPQKFFLELYVHPHSRNQKIGAGLFDATLELLKPLEAISMRVQVAENEPQSLHFAASRGFEETKRDFESHLRLAGFDETRFTSLETDQLARGVTLKSWAELNSEAFRRELHAVFSEVRLDVPRSDPPTPISFEFFEENVTNDPELLWDASFVALEGNRIIGFTGAYRSPKTGWMDQWLTATTREARGRGVAMALKVKQLRAARESEFQWIRTDNDTRNAAMLAVNEKLGFQRQPAVLSMLKTL